MTGPRAGDRGHLVVRGEGFWHALRLRCPACGRGALFAGWFRMRARCPACGLRLEREEGYFLGAMLVNLLVAELLCIGAVALLLVRTWPAPPWQWLQWGVPLLAVALPVLLYPFSRAIWLAFDLLFQPPRAEEYDRSTGSGQQEPGERR